MRYTRFHYLPQQRLPMISALLQCQGDQIPVPLPFVVDTGAERSIVMPTLEAKLERDAPEWHWDQRFGSDRVTVDTILGEAHFKVLHNGTGLCFLAEDDETIWVCPLESILFCDQDKLGAHGRVPGLRFPFGILGQDVLKKCGLMIADTVGILAPNCGAVRRMVEHPDEAEQAVRD